MIGRFVFQLLIKEANVAANQPVFTLSERVISGRSIAGEMNPGGVASSIATPAMADSFTSLFKC